MIETSPRHVDWAREFTADCDFVDSIPIRGREDMNHAEGRIAALLKGEGGRCPFLRSQAFQRFRLSILYFNPVTLPLVIHFQGLRMAWDGTNLSLSWMECVESSPLLSFSGAGPSESCEGGARKRRLCEVDDLLD